MQKINNTIAILDICSAKIVCLIAKIINEKTEILGIGYTRSEGIRGGVISDIKLAQRSISKAIFEAEKTSNIKVKRVHLTISSNVLLSQHMTIETSIFGRDIIDKDLNKLPLEAIQRYKSQQLEVIHTFTCDYILDGHRNIINPIGMYGNKLACKLHLLSIPENNLLNLYNCVTKIGLEVESYISAAYAAGLLCLTKDEMITGATLIDFGAGVTSFAVFENAQLIYTDAVPIGGNHITNDIAKILSLSIDEAERVKNLHGTIIATDEDKHDLIDIKLSDNDECYGVNRSKLIDIIKARVDEIIKAVRDKIFSNETLCNKIVITGGVARTTGLKELLSREFNTRVSIANIDIPIMPHNNLELSTAVGALTHVSKNILAAEMYYNNNKQYGSLSNFFSWIQRTFF